MKSFPEFMHTSSDTESVTSRTSYIRRVEGYVFDGADGGQMAFVDMRSNSFFYGAPVHDYDEHMFVGSEAACDTLSNSRRKDSGEGRLL